MPDGERHLPEWMNHPSNRREIDGKLTYQWTKQAAAYAACKTFRTAIDVGAHCGLWSMHMAKRFKTVQAFEPVDMHRDCFAKNISAANVTLHPYALGTETKTVWLHTGTSSSGDTYVSDHGEHAAPMRPLDSFAFTDVDFIKIDVEGYEDEVIRGGIETIKSNRPVMIVEQKGHDKKYFGGEVHRSVALLKDIGMVPLCEPMAGDWIMGWK